MTREDIILMAKEVGFDDGEIDKCQLMLEQFAILVTRQVLEEDREYESTARKFFYDKQINQIG
jgi:hypothetical protein